ncbi:MULTISPECIES: hypothetical protein [Vibrio]|uniref:hypothetical protein n=1 Tax=Vibrio TaxID=662 RepID=UPI001CDB600D|nr:MULTISPECIES: hypothetical protein [Vibrio]EIK0770541.1 hypothetical protein [Vibrio alginolyticus]MCA2487706.1 hypothetical protein [Vibrio alginolyticus]MDW1550168.1 hypothetical protein [Vibrio sp. YT-18]MDW1780440.1 hypothetical protein [Vibrio sp. Vb2134]MDW2084808.1 hypothetical protein [Vibrio sp. 2134-1]
MISVIEANKIISDMREENANTANIKVWYQLRLPRDNGKSISVRGTVIDRDSVVSFDVIFQIPLDTATKIPNSKYDIERRYATEHFQPHIMSLKDSYFEKIQVYLKLAVKENLERVANIERGTVTLENGDTIHQFAAPIHHLCETIGQIERADGSRTTDSRGLELKEYEAEDIQQALALLESILSNMGYGYRSFNVEKYQNDELAKFMDKKYDMGRTIGGLGKKEKQSKFEQDCMARFTICDESLLTPLSENATSNTTSRVRATFEALRGRAVK